MDSYEISFENKVYKVAYVTICLVTGFINGETYFN